MRRHSRFGTVHAFAARRRLTSGLALACSSTLGHAGQAIYSAAAWANFVPPGAVQISSGPNQRRTCGSSWEASRSKRAAGSRSTTIKSR